MARRLAEAAALWAYLPLPRPVIAADGGAHCICGKFVPYTGIHAHGSAAFVMTGPEAWGL